MNKKVFILMNLKLANRIASEYRKTGRHSVYVHPESHLTLIVVREVENG